MIETLSLEVALLDNNYITVLHHMNNTIYNHLYKYENPWRKAFSLRFPFLKKPIIQIHIWSKYIKNLALWKRGKYNTKTLEHTITKHQSLLRRKLGDSDPVLQEKKVINLQKAIQHIDHIILKPWEHFSFWRSVGKPTYKKWYVDGMLLSRGKVIAGVWGWLCQLSNLLYWMFLHTPMTVTERHHHSIDVFPDSGRVLPFGSGATVMYNFIDLQVHNTTPYTFQILLDITKTHLKWKIVSDTPQNTSYHITEKDHCFIKKWNTFFRYNDLYRETIDEITGNILDEEPITTNFTPVLYEVSKKSLEKAWYIVREV